MANHHATAEGPVPFTEEEEIEWEAEQLKAFRPIVPSAVNMRQARTALRQNSLYNTVNSLISNMAGAAGEQARIDWEFSQEVKRDWPLVATLTPLLNLTDEQVDALFIYAATL